MYNIKHNNLNEPVKDVFEISDNKFHILRNKLWNNYYHYLLWNNLPTAAKERGITINQFKNILGSQYSSF